MNYVIEKLEQYTRPHTEHPQTAAHRFRPLRAVPPSDWPTKGGPLRHAGVWEALIGRRSRHSELLPGDPLPQLVKRTIQSLEVPAAMKIPPSVGGYINSFASIPPRTLTK